MKTRFHKAREVFKIKNHLLKVAPYISNIDIRVSNLKNGHYKTQIHVHLPSRKNIISTKVDEKLSFSLEKAHRAAIKQVQKATKVKSRRQTIRRIDLDDAA